MKKLICIKSHGKFLTEGHIYECESSPNFYNIIYVNEGLNHNTLTFSNRFIKEHFITLAEYRDIQINNILYD